MIFFTDFLDIYLEDMHKILGYKTSQDLYPHVIYK